MGVMKTEEDKPKKPVTKTKPTRKKTPAAKKPTGKPVIRKAPSKKTVPKKAEAVKPEAANDNPEPKKPRPRSPRNGVELPEGRPFKPGEQARELGRKGGIKSAAIKKARKTLREELLELLQVESRDSEGKTHTQQERISAAMIKEAVSGNVRAFETIRDTIGEKQKDQVEVAVALPQFDNLDAAFAKLNGDAK